MKAIVPHTREWFASVKKHNPTQALHTRKVLKLAGNSEVCSVCGAEPEGDFRLGTAPEWTMRLCHVCHDLHRMYGLKLRELPAARRTLKAA